MASVFTSRKILDAIQRFTKVNFFYSSLHHIFESKNFTFFFFKVKFLPGFKNVTERGIKKIHFRKTLKIA